MHACINTCAYGTIAKIWDEISPGWLKGPLSRGLPFCGNPFLTYFCSSFTSTPATAHSLCYFFSISISFPHRSLWYVQFWNTVFLRVIW